MVHPARIQHLNDKPVGSGRFVVYWMQQAQRIRDNHALAYAIGRANELDQPLVVFFGLTDHFPGANLRHYRFMLEGLADVKEELRKRGIALIIRKTEPDKGAIELGRHASMIVCDRGYLRIQKIWRHHVSQQSLCPVVQVETDVVVPVGVASGKEEYSAATLRPKVLMHLHEFLEPVRIPSLKKESLHTDLHTLQLHDIDAVLDGLDTDRHVAPVNWIRGGTAAALKRLDHFIDRDLDRFDQARNDPAIECRSNMSPYLHFGQISPATVANAVLAAGSKSAPRFLEELIVRRELAMNFTDRNRHYDSIAGLPAWAATTLEKHLGDKREYVYFPYELENSRTHDPCWNAAQKELVKRGIMHGYMRMYWGKKILEWSRTPHAAFGVACYLNNKYALDGRDPSSFAGIAWCFGKHDRPWAERSIFGTVRFMNDKGLERKFNMDSYLKKIDDL